MLVARGLRKRYRSREVVRDFGLTLDAGEVVGLLGPNGAGKTTCFYMIVGLVPADAGQIVLDGRDITGDPRGQGGQQQLIGGLAHSGIGPLTGVRSVWWPDWPPDRGRAV